MKIENCTHYTYTSPYCLQFDTITMILDRRVKSPGVSEEEHDFMIGTPMM